MATDCDLRVPTRKRVVASACARSPGPAPFFTIRRRSYRGAITISRRPGSFVALSVLERREIDAWDAELEELRSFILPGGGKSASIAHLARAACRRAERAVVGLQADDLPETIVPYLNRLSDWLFTCARAMNRREGVDETVW